MITRLLLESSEIECGIVSSYLLIVNATTARVLSIAVFFYTEGPAYKFMRQVQVLFTAAVCTTTSMHNMEFSSTFAYLYYVLYYR